jgi:hypothetical protein
MDPGVRRVTNERSNSRLKRLMPDIVELDRPQLIGLGGDVFRRLEAGDILVVRGLDEILALAGHLEATLRQRHGAAVAGRVHAFFDRAEPLSEDDAAALIAVLREIRDTRFLSCLFADLIAGFGLPAGQLIDTGFFRCIFRRHHDGLNARKALGTLPADLFEMLTVSEPEPMVTGGPGGHPHRDLDPPHYTFQINFWFPLHPVPAENSLLMFPDVYTTDIPYQQTPAILQKPETWGYGRPMRRALQLGDTLIFHSQHLHASPTEAPDLDRVTVELRAASGCHDDNASVYRRLYWRIENFQGPGAATALDRAARLHPHAPRPPADALTGHEIFALLFADSADARRAANAWTPDTVFAGSRRLPAPELLDIAGRLRAMPFAEDRQLAFARYLLFHGRRDLARLTLDDVVRRTGSYFFALETARIAAAAQFFDVAEAGLRRALDTAAASPARIGRYRGDVPTRPDLPIQLMPAQALATAERLLAVLGEYRAAPAGRPAPWLDHRLFFTNYVSARPFGEAVILFVWSVLLYVPPPRIAELGLRVIPAETAGTEARVDVSGYRPEAVAGNPEGIVVGYDMLELFQKLCELRLAEAQAGSPAGAPATTP